MDKLLELIAKGPDPTRGLRGLALARYHDITTARAQLSRWGEIATALGLSAQQGPAIADAYRRVARRVAVGKLKPPSATPVPQPAAAPRQGRQAGISTGAATGERPAPPERAGFKRIDID